MSRLVGLVAALCLVEVGSILQAAPEPWLDVEALRQARFQQLGVSIVRVVVLGMRV